MKEDQYNTLCEACDRVLLSPDSTFERVAIPWLHVIREHPEFLKSYADLFKPGKGKRYHGQWARILRKKVGLLRQFAIGFLSNGSPWACPERLTTGIDVLFVSHLLRPSHAGQVDDFYFGSVPDEIVAQGGRAVIALINYSRQSGPLLASKWEGSAVERVIFSNATGIFDYVRLYRRLSTESINLRKLATQEKPVLLRRVLTRASEEALSVGSITTLRIASQIKALVGMLKPKSLVVTYEGHAWERLAFASARMALPGIRCVGYQHAAIFRLQYAIRRNLARAYNPDQILTAGMVGKKQLERDPGVNGTLVSVLGSNRIFKSVTTKGDCAIDQYRSELSNKYVCLVVPEGFAGECFLLFEFSLACAQLCPEIQFIWRLHPIVTFRSLLAQNWKLRNLPRNIVLSQATLEEDTARCMWALYRGTTAIVQAVVAGLRPIYLQQPGEMTIDSLYELNAFRAVVTNVSEFKEVTDIDINRGVGIPDSEKDEAKKYCEGFYLPFDSGVLLNQSESIRPPAI